MSEPSNANVEVAERLLAYVRAAEVETLDSAEAAGRAYQALFRTLTPIIGAAGAQALFL